MTDWLTYEGDWCAKYANSSGINAFFLGLTSSNHRFHLVGEREEIDFVHATESDLDRWSPALKVKIVMDVKHEL